MQHEAEDEALSIAIGVTRDIDDDCQPQVVALATPPRPSNQAHPSPNEDLLVIDPHGTDSDTSSSMLKDDFFTSLQWTPDGTSLLLSSASNRLLHTYILPPDLLSPITSSSHRILTPYHTHHLPAPTWATAIHPSFSLSTPESCLYLASPHTLPIRLVSPFASNVLATYPLIHEPTESWITPQSLLFHRRDGNLFFAGKAHEICLFDITRNGEGPYARMATGRWTGRRTKAFGVRAPSAAEGDLGGGLSKGVVGAMAMNTEGLLAVGTFNREAGMVDTNTEGGMVVKLALPKEEGAGVTQVKFHPEPSKGNYMVVASRKSDVLHVFDVRNPNSLLATLVGRQGMTQQRLGIDITENGEVWAGGIDGLVRVWEGLGIGAGRIHPSLDWRAHEDAIGGIGLHPGGAGVLASCAGSRHFDDDKKITDPSHQDNRSSDNGTVKYGAEASDAMLKVYML